MFTLVLLGFCFLGIELAKGSEEGVGHIKTAQGPVHIQRQNQRVPATVGTVVQSHDQLVTGKMGALGVVFNDHTVVSLGAESSYQIDDFIYQPNNDLFSYQAILKSGSMQVRSGRIAKYSPQSMQLRTPTANIGVRGTRFIVQVEKEPVTPIPKDATKSTQQ